MGENMKNLRAEAEAPRVAYQVGSMMTAGLAPGQHLSVARKREVSLRLLRGEALKANSKKMGAETYMIEQLRDKRFLGINAACKRRRGRGIQFK